MSDYPPTLWDLPESGQSRTSDPATSLSAALSVRPGSARFALLKAHANFAPTYGLTDEQACELAGLSLRSEYATRCSELERAGLLENTAETRPGDSGLARMVRHITPSGLSALTGWDR